MFKKIIFTFRKTLAVLTRLPSSAEIIGIGTLVITLTIWNIIIIIETFDDTPQCSCFGENPFALTGYMLGLWKIYLWRVWTCGHITCLDMWHTSLDEWSDNPVAVSARGGRWARLWLADRSYPRLLLVCDSLTCWQTLTLLAFVIVGAEIVSVWPRVITVTACRWVTLEDYKISRY